MSGMSGIERGLQQQQCGPALSTHATLEALLPRNSPNRHLGLIPTAAIGQHPSGANLYHISQVMIVSALVATLCACSTPKNSNIVDETQKLSPRMIRVGDPVPKGGGTYMIGNPYLAGGKWYVPVNDPGYDQVGLASWYGDYFHGRQTANGEIYDMNALTAAHPTLPLPTYATVTNLANNRTIVVRINDRGPYHSDRIIDLSRRAAELLGFHGHGTAAVRVRYLAPAPLNGDDSLERSILARQPWVTRTVRTETARKSAASTMVETAAMTAEPRLVVQKGNFERHAPASAGGWTTAAQSSLTSTATFTPPR
jgi:rare lipoprotein A